MSVDNAPLDPDARRRARRAVVAASLGNALEWFDIIVYAFFAPVISKVFFEGSKGNDYVGQLLTFGTFALSYLIRPLGAMVIGHFGDRHGRRSALTLTIALMTVGVAMMAVVPSYARIGISAPLLVLLSRLIQGFSAGGEFGSSTAFLTESAEHRKSYYASFQVATQGISLLLAGISGWVLNTQISQHSLYTWGFRVPFLVGLLIGPVGLWIRRNLDDSQEFASAEHEDAPLVATLTHHLGRVLTAAASVGMATMSIYLITYMPTMATRNLGMPSWSPFVGTVIAGIVTLVLSPAVGHLADRIGPVHVMAPAAVVGAIVIWPAFHLLVHHHTVLVLTLVEAMVGLLMSFYFAPLPGLVSSLFPVGVRTTGMSLGYNIGVTLMGGLAPTFLTWLVKHHGLTSPSWYYIAVCVISLLGLASASRVYHQD